MLAIEDLAHKLNCKVEPQPGELRANSGSHSLEQGPWLLSYSHLFGKILAAAQTNRNRANQAMPHLELSLTKDLPKTSSTQRTEMLIKEKLWILWDEKVTSVACSNKNAHAIT